MRPTGPPCVAASAHLRACADCTDELISAVVAHASLSSAARYAPEVVLDDPASATRTAAADEPDADDGADGTQDRAGGANSGAGQAAAPSSLPDLSARVRAGPQRSRRDDSGDDGRCSAAPPPSAVTRGGTPAPAHRGGRRRRGGGGPGHRRGRCVRRGPPRLAVEPARSRSAPSASGTTDASATVVGGRQIHLDASSLPAAAAGKYYEVWLTDGAGRTWRRWGRSNPTARDATRCRRR